VGVGVGAGLGVGAGVGVGAGASPKTGTINSVPISKVTTAIVTETDKNLILVLTIYTPTQPDNEIAVSVVLS
jgi:hypothetical protein